MDIFEKLKEKIVSKIDCDPSKVTRDTSLIGLGIDSLDTVEMIMDLEEELGVELEFDEAVTTVDDLVKFIEKRLKEKENA
jgi:acyl carrier protein